MPKIKDEKKALRESFDVYGKVIIASLQFETELSEHVYDILKQMQDSMLKAGIELGRGKKEWKWDNSSEGERYLGVRVPIKKFRSLDVDKKTRLYFGLAFSLWIEKEIEAFPYVALSVDYPSNSKENQRKWQDHFKKAKAKLDKNYQLKSYAGCLYLWPAKPNTCRRKSLDEINQDLHDIMSQLLKMV